MEETKIIYEIKDVKVGDIAYYEGAEKGSIVVGVDSHDDYSIRLKIETPEEFKPFNVYGDTSVWLQNSYFRYATRQTLNKRGVKSLPDAREGHSRVFETQSQTRIIYAGAKFRGWRIEPLLSDKSLLELLDASQFPLKDITEVEES